MDDPGPQPPVIDPVEHRVAIDQRAFLMRVVESMAQRLAGSHMAAGLINLQGAAAFSDQELAKVQAGMGAIHQAGQPPQAAAPAIKPEPEQEASAP